MTQKEAALEDPGAAGLFGTGTVGTILQLLKLPDGAVKVLVEGGADVIRRDAAGWSVVQQAARLHDRALLESMVRASFVQVWQTWQNRVQWLLPMLKEIPDFDLTMEWDFACCVPLVTNMLPSDQLHVRKSGGKLRVDSSLASFSGMKWKHGRFSTLILLDEGGTTSRECWD